MPNSQNRTNPNSNSICPQCGNALAAGVVNGKLCPKCLLGMGLGMGLGMKHGLETLHRSSSPSPRFEPISPSDIDKEFPDLDVIGLIGVGGMGAVYQARQTELKRNVALKILPPEIAENPDFAIRFEREAQTLASLNHPNIVQIYHVGKTKQYFYFLMEFVDGVNLRQAIRDGNLSPEEALAIVPQICSALQYAHDQGVVHRDIKPENILLDENGQVKVTDFGLAKMANLNIEASLTGTRQIMGTAHYMAPEQIQETRNVDHRADIYSLGVVFYEMLTGQLPLGRFAPPSANSNIDPRLDDVVLRTLENEPDRRYQAASQVRSDIHSLATQTKENHSIPVASERDTLSSPVPIQAVNAPSIPTKQGRLANRKEALRKVHMPATFLQVIGSVGLLAAVVVFAFFFVLMWSASRSYSTQEMVVAPRLTNLISLAGNSTMCFAVSPAFQEFDEFSNSAMASPDKKGDIALLALFIPGLAFISLPIFILMMVAGARMKQLRSHGFAVFVSILALLPLNPFLFLFSLFAGIWSLIVLNDSNVRLAFEEQRAIETMSKK